MNEQFIVKDSCEIESLVEVNMINLPKNFVADWKRSVEFVLFLSFSVTGKYQFDVSAWQYSAFRKKC